VARIAAGDTEPSQLALWNRQFAAAGAELSRSRGEAIAEMSDHYVRAAGELGLAGENELIYRAGSTDDPTELEKGLEQRLEADLKLGRTGWGPHHDEVRLEQDGRQLRRFGSQGQQRIGLLSLFFAERDALLAAGATPPLMLLDDVMSELDSERRGLLVDRLLEGGQSVVTAAESELIPDRAGLKTVWIRELTAALEEVDAGEG
jgi:DNA replication and repair protein RecF